MTKQEVNICDICKKVVADFKCEFCGSDTCIECSGNYELGAGKHKFFTFSCCVNCYEILNSDDVSLTKDFENYPKLKEELKEIFKKVIQLEELEGNIKPYKRLSPLKLPPSSFVNSFPFQTMANNSYQKRHRFFTTK